MRLTLNLLKVILLILLATIIEAKNAPYSYSYMPKTVYKNQIFPVTILVKHYDSSDPLHFDYDIVSPIQPIDPKPLKLINKSEAFFTLYFKADTQEKELIIPQLSIWNLNYTYMLQAKKIKVLDISTNAIDNFSGVIASNLRVNSIKVDPYDVKNSLVTLTLEANEANLEDIKLPDVVDDGIESIDRKGSKVTLRYYFIAPSKKKSIELVYYNLIKNSFELKDISLVDRVGFTENIKLAPKDLSFEKIKKYIFIVTTLIFMILLIVTKDILYLIISILLISFLIYSYYPKGSVCIEEGASIYILPTQNSNISMQTDMQTNSKIIKRYNNFTKIEYKNKISGWIKDEDICKD